MNVNNISPLKRNLIFEALDMWHSCDENTSDFTSKMIKLGWSNSILYEPGSFKTCLWKKSIIVKFAHASADSPLKDENDAELKREYEQYKIAPKGFKKIPYSLIYFKKRFTDTR